MSRPSCRVCENRISTTSLLPGDLIGSLVRQDHRGIQCRRRGPPHSGRRPDVGHPEGGLHAPCGRRHADGRDLRHAWLCGHGRYGERRRLVCHARARPPPTPASASGACRTSRNMKSSSASDLGDVRNTSQRRLRRDHGRAVPAALHRGSCLGCIWTSQARRTTRAIVWEHQVPGATGTAVSTLYPSGLRAGGK